MRRMRRCVAAVVLLSLLSGGLSAPLGSCDSRVKPITLSKEDLLGRWLYIGGTSDLPGFRSVIHLVTSISLNLSATAQSNVLDLIQTQRIFGKCSSIALNVTFENSTMLLEQPFHIKEVYLPTSCSDCLVAYEEATFGKDAVGTSLMLLSRRQSVSPDVVEEFKTQAECLRMLPPIMIDTDYELCPVDASPTDGVSGIKAVNSLFKTTMELGVGLGLLDSFFETFVN